MASFIQKHPRITLLLINVVLLGSLLILIEFVLRHYFPYHFATIGHQASENAAKYGWGFSPGESIQLLDPDTGETYVSKANSHGWRDKERHYENPTGAYRILILGDSITFGAIVPQESIYTQLLEQRLKKEGYNAEVITIAYGGWGTDQELEALVNEGLAYKPNLVVVQFCKNDLTDNSYYYRATVTKDADFQSLAAWKPFYYDFDEQGSLRRNLNPNFSLTNSESKYSRIEKIIFHSQILTRAYAVYRNLKARQEAVETGKYRSSNDKLTQLGMVIGLTPRSSLYKFLEERKNKSISEPSLDEAVEASGLQEKKAIIQRILEDRWFNNYWSVKGFYPPSLDAPTYVHDWKLYFALMSEIKSKASSINTPVAVIVETEQGHYEWERSWYRIAEDETPRNNYLSHIPIIKSMMSKLGVDFIENTEPYQRARNDPHPNVQGNQSMANDVYEYLMTQNRGLKKQKRRTSTN